MILFIFISPLMKLQKKEFTTFPPIICRKLFFHYLNLSGIHQQYPPLFFPPCFRNILSKITVFLVTFCNFLLIIRHYIFLPLKFPFFTFFCQSCFAPRYFAQFYFSKLFSIFSSLRACSFNSFTNFSLSCRSFL